MLIAVNHAAIPTLVSIDTRISNKGNISIWLKIATLNPISTFTKLSNNDSNLDWFISAFLLIM